MKIKLKVMRVLIGAGSDADVIIFEVDGPWADGCDYCQNHIRSDLEL